MADRAIDVAVTASIDDMVADISADSATAMTNDIRVVFDDTKPPNDIIAALRRATEAVTQDLSDN